MFFKNFHLLFFIFSININYNFYKNSEQNKIPEISNYKIAGAFFKTILPIIGIIGIFTFISLILKIVTRFNNVFFLPMFYGFYSVRAKTKSILESQLRDKKEFNKNINLEIKKNKESEIIQKIDESIYSLYYVHGTIRYSIKFENLRNILAVFMHSIGLPCICSKKSDSTFIKKNYGTPYSKIKKNINEEGDVNKSFYNMMLWNGQLCSYLREECGKELANEIKEKINSRKKDGNEKKKIFIVGHSYGVEVLLKAIGILLHEKINLENIAIVSLGGIFTDETAKIAYNFMKKSNENIIMLFHAPLDYFAILDPSNSDVSYYKKNKKFLEIFGDVDDTKIYSYLTNETKNQIASFMVWDTKKNSEVVPLEHIKLKNLFYNFSFFEIFENFDKYKGEKINLILS